VRWLHTGGIFAALSESAADTVIEAVTAAKKYGTSCPTTSTTAEPVEGDRRPGQGAGGQPGHRAFIDVMIGNEEDFTASLGFEVEGVDENLSALQVTSSPR